MAAYDPFTYNPTLRAFFVTGTEKAAKVAAEQPQIAQHINSVWGFLDWMQRSSPELYATITNRRPDLVDPAEVVTSGKLAAKSGKTVQASKAATIKATKGPMLKGMDDADIEVTTSPDTQTSWGSDLLDTIKQLVPSYLQFKGQKDLMELNIKRAEQGLPPIDSGQIAPTVNVGVSKNVQTLAYVAVGGLMLVGLLSAFKKR